MLPSDIEVVVREGYHVSHSVAILSVHACTWDCTALFIHVVLGSIVVSISACHAEDPGSIPGRGV